MKSSLFRPDFPFSPAKFPIFYGWVILIASVLGVLTSVPGQTMGVSVFTDYLIEATGLSRLQLANAYLVGTLTSGCLLPLGGKLLDRLGARRIVVLAAVGLGLTLCYLSMCDRISIFLGQWLPFSAVSMAAAVLVVGFVSLRFCGQGMLTMTSRATLGKWFNKRRGLVSGIEGVFIAYGFSIAPKFFSKAIEHLGWRGTWLALGLVIGLGMSTVGWLLFRDTPENCGLHMDGETVAVAHQSLAIEQDVEQVSDTEQAMNIEQPMWGATRGQALSTLIFWACTLAFASQALSSTGITFNIVSIGEEMEISKADIVNIFVPIAFVSTAVGFGVGLACTWIRIQYLFIFMMVFQAMGIAALANLDAAWMFFPAVVGLGVSSGCFGTLSTVVLPRFFGRKHLGAIAGIQMMVIVVASALGPSLLASSKSATGSYASGLYACCAFAPVVIVTMLFVQPPDKF